MSRDTSIHFRLSNWGRFQRDGMKSVPSRHPKSASWQGQIVNVGDIWDADPPDPIDDDDAEDIQVAIIRCTIHDLKSATILKKHYRDGWSISEKVIKTARNKFWKYL